MTATTAVKPAPMAAERPFQITYHGKSYQDPFHWLRDDTKGSKKAEDIMAYLKEENAYTAATLAPCKALEDTLYAEFLARLKEEDTDVPIKKGDYAYYKRTEKGKQYAIRCRRRLEPNPGTTDSPPEEILLDLNTMSHEFMDIGQFKVSPSGKFLAYSMDTTGGESYTIYLKNLETGEHVDAFKITGSYGSLEWSNDNETLYFDLHDDIHRPYRLCRASIASALKGETTAPVYDVLYEEADLKMELDFFKSNSQRFIFIHSTSSLTCEVRYIDADAGYNAEPTLFKARELNVKYKVDHAKDTFFILTNDQHSTNFRLCTSTLADHTTWVNVFPYDEQVYLESMDAFQDYLVLYERKQGLRHIRVVSLDPTTGQCVPDQQHYISFDRPVYTYRCHGSQQFHDNILRYTFTSLNLPETVIDHQLSTGKQDIRKVKEVLGGFNADDYVVERIHVPSHEDANVLIPVSLAYRRDVKTSPMTPKPCFLYGYGSYGISIDPSFRSTWISYMDRGMVVAIAHIRGGGDNGRTWYEAGKFLHKKNTFTDFIDVARHLVATGWTSPDRLAIEGRSAGGLLIGAVLNAAPDLFRVAVAGVPFVDVTHTMMDASIPLTVNEYEEWGDPNDPLYFNYMHSYSPYDNLKENVVADLAKHTHILVRAGLTDPRVQYWEPAKYTAKYRSLRRAIAAKEGGDACDKVFLLDMQMGAGHFGASGRYHHLRQSAMELAFVIHYLGLHEKSKI